MSARRAPFPDPAFRADARLARPQVDAPRNAQEVQNIVDRVYHMPAKVISRLKLPQQRMRDDRSARFTMPAGRPALRRAYQGRQAAAVDLAESSQ
jgi:hypothetical protein